MAKTRILPTDPGAVKKFEDEVGVEAQKRFYFGKMTGGESAKLPVVRKSSLESGPGDELTVYMIGKLTGKPREGEEKLAGFEDKLSHFTDKLRIDRHRRAVNCGDIMAQKRVPFQIAEQVKARLAEYAASVMDEQIVMHASGARGVGTEIQNFPVGYNAFPNSFLAPDTAHRQVWDGSIAYGSLVTNTHKLTRGVIDAAQLRAKKMIGALKDAKAPPMQKCSVGEMRGDHYVFLTGPEGMFDLRNEAGDAGFLALERAAITAEGKKNLIFTGGSALVNGVLVDEMQTIVKFNDAGAGSVLAMRSLFLGAHAVAVAYGMRGNNNNTRYELTEHDIDLGGEEVIAMQLIAGWKKLRYNGLDHGVIAVDHTYTLAAGETI